MSNYSKTQLSIASSLNMEYLQNLDPLYNDPNKRTRAALPALTREGAARRYLEGLGYKTVGFASGYGWTDLRDADVFLTPEGGYRETVGLLGGANEFEVMLMDTSALILVTDATLKLPAMLKPDLQSHNRHVARAYPLHSGHPAKSPAPAGSQIRLCPHCHTP